jgi:hypothetical protein
VHVEHLGHHALAPTQSGLTMLSGDRCGAADDLADGLTVQTGVTAGIAAHGPALATCTGRAAMAAPSPVQSPPIQAALRVGAGPTIEPSS